MFANNKLWNTTATAMASAKRTIQDTICATSIDGISMKKIRGIAINTTIIPILIKVGIAAVLLFTASVGVTQVRLGLCASSSIAKQLNP